MAPYVLLSRCLALRRCLPRCQFHWPHTIFTLDYRLAESRCRRQVLPMPLLITIVASHYLITLAQMLIAPKISYLFAYCHCFFRYFHIIKILVITPFFSRLLMLRDWWRRPLCCRYRHCRLTCYLISTLFACYLLRHAVGYYAIGASLMVIISLVLPMPYAAEAAKFQAATLA